MTIASRKLLGRGTVAVAFTLFAVVAWASIGTNPDHRFPADWTDPALWQGGQPNQQGGVTMIGQQQDGTPVDGVIVDLDSNNAIAHHVNILNGAKLNIRSGAGLQMHNLTCVDDATVNLSGNLVTDLWVIKDGARWNLLPGAFHRHRAGGGRIGQHEGGMVFWTISGGVYENTGDEFLIGEMESSAVINQGAGLAKFQNDIHFRNTEDTPNKWYIWGGQLVVTGNAEDPRDYVKMQHHGAPGGIVLSGEGEVFVRGDRTEDLTLLDSDGDALLSGAQFAEFGDWTLSDGTAISGYTRFRALLPAEN